MAGSVLNWTFGFQINISAKLKVGASKSATSASCETLAVIVKDGQLKNVLLKNMTKTEIAEAFSNGEFEKTNNFNSNAMHIDIL